MSGSERVTSIAERVACYMGNDGSKWYTLRGTRLEDLCEGIGAYYSVRQADGIERYEFDDGSAILFKKGVWGVEGAEKWTLRGAE